MPVTIVVRGRRPPDKHEVRIIGVGRSSCLVSILNHHASNN